MISSKIHRQIILRANSGPVGKSRVKAYLNVLLQDLMVLLLLVQHVLLLGLLQGSLIHLPPVHLLQLLTLLQGKQFRPEGCSQVHHMQ